MINSDDPIEFVLSRTFVAAPGTKWNYNGGATQLLASVIEKVSGLKVNEFANEYLFKPLGIQHFEWIKYPGTTLPAAASGLRLSARDLLKFGLLYANEGEWNGNQVVPANWVEASFTSHTDRPNGGSYGYQFWIWSDTISGRNLRIVAAIGNGDQRIFFDEANDLVVVVTAGNYNQGLSKNSYALLKDFIYPGAFE